MKKIKKEINIWFWASLLVSILFVVGIPIIPLFAGKNWFVAALGIFFTVFGFYGMPFFWIKYGSLFGMKNLVLAITEENILTTRGIAIRFQITEVEARRRILKAMNKRYIEGFLFDGEVLTLNENEKPAYKVDVRTCENCAARLEVTDDKVYCEYCGTIYTKMIHKKNK